jgi:pyridoxine 5'-phosphate synthase PdxJ
MLCRQETNDIKLLNPHSVRLLVMPVLKAMRNTNSGVKELGLGLNAGHDLDLQNLKFLNQNIPWLDEVSIGHALICDAIYLGLENAVQLYKKQLA